MPATYSANIKNARMQAVLDGIDAAGAGATIEICSAAYAAVLAALPLAFPCGSLAADVLTLDTTPPLEDASANATGVAALARVKDAGGTIRASGLVCATAPGPGVDIVLGTLNITAGLKVQITSATLTHG